MQLLASYFPNVASQMNFLKLWKYKKHEKKILDLQQDYISPQDWNILDDSSQLQNIHEAPYSIFDINDLAIYSWCAQFRSNIILNYYSTIRFFNPRMDKILVQL